MPMIFSIYENEDRESWIMSTVLNDDQADQLHMLIVKAELAGLEWESVRPDSLENLLKEMETA